MQQDPYTAPRNSTTALISLVSGILGWTFLPLLGSIVAIITGHMAKSEIKQSVGTIGGDGMATAGLILGYVAIGLGILAVCAIIVLSVLGVGLFLPFVNS